MLDTLPSDTTDDFSKAANPDVYFGTVSLPKPAADRPKPGAAWGPGVRGTRDLEVERRARVHLRIQRFRHVSAVSIPNTLVPWLSGQLQANRYRVQRCAHLYGRVVSSEASVVSAAASTAALAGGELDDGRGAAPAAPTIVVHTYYEPIQVMTSEEAFPLDGSLPAGPGRTGRVE